MSGEFWLWALCALLLALWLLNFLRTDCDLTLLWAEWLGRSPGEALLWSSASKWETSAGSISSWATSDCGSPSVARLGFAQVRVRVAETEQREQFGVLMTRSDLKMESFRLPGWESSLEVAKLLLRENILKTLPNRNPSYPKQYQTLRSTEHCHAKLPPWTKFQYLFISKVFFLGSSLCEVLKWYLSPFFGYSWV